MKKRVRFTIVIAASSAFIGATISGCSHSASGPGSTGAASATTPPSLQQELQATAASNMPPAVKQHRMQELQMYTGHTQRPSSVIR